MIYKAEFITGSADLSGVYSDIGVKIHGAAMGLVKREYAEFLHLRELHPFSIYAVPSEEGHTIMRVSALNDEAWCIIEGFLRVRELTIYGADKPLHIEPQSIAPPLKASAAGELLKGDDCRMIFASPAMYKSNGKVCFLPELEMFFLSVIRKYNKFENDELVFEEFRKAFAEGNIKDYELKSTVFNAGGNMFRGMTGFVDYIFPKSRAELVKRVLAYATYCGVGGKTGMGMGGFIIS